MKTKSSDRAEIGFYSSRNQRIAAQLLEVVLIQPDDEVSVCNLLIQVNYPTYQLIQNDGLFNLFADQVLVSSSYTFEAREIEIDLRLKPQFLAYLLDRAQTPDEIVDFFAQLKTTEPDGFLLNSENWLAVAVVQAESLPAEFEDGGTLKAGYQTLWEKPEILKQQLMASVSDPFSTTVIEYLQANGIEYEEASEGVLRLRYGGQNGEWICLIKLDEATQQCAVYSVLPDLIPEKGRKACAVMLAYTNYDLTIGNFEIDLEDGELRYRTAIDLSGDRLTPALFENLLTTNVNTMDRYFLELQQFHQL